ncbi:hypothetical protein BOTBODRAFT_36611 [Botryobasidium botryosum FD-172 SS1]|uniref:Protein kinase domain-containing protein n=1 Tax=Botryobasidium botryosum (strain FD-172 SS1) TaxID=930990 RepID=A0A067M2J5_BOTB1|nr:hypothetical protein BOTBODRAFT_36611 [Botryobasidium botryosum FD-172 SS1]
METSDSDSDLTDSQLSRRSKSVYEPFIWSRSSATRSLSGNKSEVIEKTVDDDLVHSTRIMSLRRGRSSADPSFSERLIGHMRQAATYLKGPPSIEVVDLLSQLYANSKYYPCEATLHAWEVSRTGDTPFGCGGFGDCWKGLLLGRHKMVLKCSRSHIPNEIAMRRAEREMKVWKRLRHPNVLPFIGSVVLESTSTFYMVAPWMENGDLGQYLKLNPDADYVALLAQVAAGLEYLHTSDPVVVHGDLKAANILVSDVGEACIADFGLSDMVIESNEFDAKSNGYSSAWKNGGNPRWQAPELFLDYKRTTQSDIFAYGRVIYEAFTGTLPFSELREYQIYSVVERGELPPRPEDAEARAKGFSNSMWEFMALCCSKAPERRPRALDVAEHMHSVLDFRKGLTDSEPIFYLRHTPTAPSDSLIEDNIDASGAKPILSEKARILLDAVVAENKIPILSLLKYLRKEMATSSPQHRSQYINLLLSVYEQTRSYPLEPILSDDEVVCPDGTPSPYLGPQGIFLGRHKVTLKIARVDPVVERSITQKRILQEAKAWKKLRHPCVLPLIGLWSHESLYYAVTPWSKEDNLQGHLMQNSNEDRVYLLLQIAHAIQYLHTQTPIVHSDLRSTKILINTSREAWLVPIWIYPGDHTWSRKWNLRWLAPELLGPGDESEEPARTAESDIFAFGRLIIEVFTGSWPFERILSDEVVLSHVLKGKLPDRPVGPGDEMTWRGLDDRMWELVRDCNHTSPSRRPTAPQVVSRLYTMYKRRSEPRRGFSFFRRSS